MQVPAEEQIADRGEQPIRDPAAVAGARRVVREMALLARGFRCPLRAGSWFSPHFSNRRPVGARARAGQA